MYFWGMIAAPTSELHPILEKGQIVILDNDLASGGEKVEVVEQTPRRLFTVVKDLDSGRSWIVMSYRLTPTEPILKFENEREI